MTVQFGIANEQQLVRGFAGIQTFRGVPVAPDFKLYGELNLDVQRPLIQRTEYTGTFFGKKTPARGPLTITGTYRQNLSFEDLAILPRLSVATAPAGVSDGESDPGYTYTYRPHGTRINVDSATAEYLYPGLPFRVEDLHFPQFTIAIDPSDAEAAWRFDATAWARNHEPIAGESGVATGGSTTTVVKTGAGWTVNEHAGAFVTVDLGTPVETLEIASNTADTLTVVGQFTEAVVNLDAFAISGQFTAGIADRNCETIDAMGTTVYFDDEVLNIGDTPSEERIRSVSVTFNANTSGKRFVENRKTFGKRLGKGETLVTGQVIAEFDSLREYNKWADTQRDVLRIHQTGSTIDVDGATTKEARIDIYAAYYDTFARQVSENNVLGAFGFWGFLDAAETTIIEIASKVELATLP